VGLPTTEGIGGNETSPVIFRWLSHIRNRRVNHCGGRHIKRTRETSRIGRFGELVAQIQERLVVGGLGTQAFVWGIRGQIRIVTRGRVGLGIRK